MTASLRVSNDRNKLHGQAQDQAKASGGGGSVAKLVAAKKNNLIRILAFLFCGDSFQIKIDSEVSFSE